jgi:hypothetical protein
MSDPLQDWLAVHAPERDAVAVVQKRAAAKRLAQLVNKLPRIVTPLVELDALIKWAGGKRG